MEGGTVSIPGASLTLQPGALARPAFLSLSLDPSGPYRLGVDDWFYDLPPLDISPLILRATLPGERPDPYLPTSDIVVTLSLPDNFAARIGPDARLAIYHSDEGIEPELHPTLITYDAATRTAAFQVQAWAFTKLWHTQTQDWTALFIPVLHPRAQARKRHP